MQGARNPEFRQPDVVHRLERRRGNGQALSLRNVLAGPRRPRLQAVGRAQRDRMRGLLLVQGSRYDAPQAMEIASGSV
jgi:hypothetical protein